MRTWTGSTTSLRWPALLSLAPFLLLAIVFAATDLLAVHRVSQLRAEAYSIEKDMLTDIELVSRMQDDLEHVKVLADQHVFEKDASVMANLENRIARTQDGFDAAVAEYESMPLLPGEEEPWFRVKAAVSDMRPRLAEVLALSRGNDDDVAYRKLLDIQGDLDTANDNLHSIIDFNSRSAHGTGDRVAVLYRSATTLLEVLAVAGVGFLLAVGIIVTRALQRSNLQLHRYADRLEAANRELDAFAGRVAHDLRTPLTTATLAASRLSRQSAPEQRKSFDLLNRAFGRMSEIIGDLLALSRVEAGEPAAVGDPAVAAGGLREELAPRVQGADTSLIIDVQPARVRCSEGLLRQVMWNLTDNAIKYRRTQVDLRVEVCGRAVDDRYELSVRDNGVGIAAGERDRVFEPFYRAGTDRPGTGLGLSIVKRAVEANGGSISVTSQPGSGSTFVARLPLA